MGANEKRDRAEQTVVVFGGCGGLTSRYREVVEARGWSLRHYEKRVPSAARHGAGKIALVVVIVTMVSHPLREAAVELASDGTQIVYLKSASPSALRAAVEQAQPSLRMAA
jgi:hypothetical protein